VHAELSQAQAEQMQQQQKQADRPRLPDQEAVERIPFDARNHYLEEVHDILQETGLAGVADLDLPFFRIC